MTKVVSKITSKLWDTQNRYDFVFGKIIIGMDYFVRCRVHNRILAESCILTRAELIKDDFK